MPTMTQTLRTLGRMAGSIADEEGQKRKRARDEARFWAKVEKTDTCWIWIASIDANGYGQFSLDGMNVRAHRVAYELEVGPIPDGLHLDHLCRVRNCVRPAHLEPVTQQENIARGFGASAINSRKNKCNNGHPLRGDNLVVRRGWRECRTCRNEGDKRRYHENKGELSPRRPVGVTAINAAKTHCIHGHEFSKENTLVLKNGNRQCRMCHRERNRLYHTRKKAATCV